MSGIIPLFFPVSQSTHERTSRCLLNEQTSLLSIVPLISSVTFISMKAPSFAVKKSPLMHILNSGWHTLLTSGFPPFCCFESSMALSSTFSHVGGGVALRHKVARTIAKLTVVQRGPEPASRSSSRPLIANHRV